MRWQRAAIAGASRVALALLLLAPAARAFDAYKFKKCADNAFCRRHRARADAPADSYAADASTLAVESDELRVIVASSEHRVPLELRLTAAGDALTARVRLKELEPLHPRFEVPHVLVDGAAAPAPLRVLARDAAGVTVALGAEGAGGGEVRLEFSPLRLHFSAPAAGAPAAAPLVRLATLNARGLLEYEHYRQRPAAAAGGEAGAAAGEGEAAAGEGPEQPEAEPAEPPVPAPPDSTGLWEEEFQSHRDTKPKGPASIGLDFSLHGFEHVYGLPEHATALSLKDTRGEGAYPEPYRLFNLDVFEYDLDSPFALYGSVPLLLAHAPDRAVGVLWLNAAEMYVDVARERGGGGGGGGLFGGGGKGGGASAVHTHWMAESGVLDAFVLLGPTPRALARQHTRLVGTPFLPPLFALGYHQCRWNYNDEADVRAVDAAFEAHDFPYDVLWLDIEHTDGKRYFTWDERKFPRPAALQEALGARGHRTVVIIDPHIKRDEGYEVHAQATSRGLYVRTHANETFDGWCWPGSSSYLDFLQPDVRAFWAERLQLRQYAGSTRHLHVWNDMNEPSVFNGPEVTMQKDCLHANGGVEHRDVHNLYGHLQAMATRQGLLEREMDGPAGAQRKRPFVLTRAFFAGTQRLAAVWTGDNMAKWEHLAAATPMLLTLGLGGITFCGADVGGFFYNPDTELLERWYQAGAYYPFFRAHAHIETKRREPWLFGEQTLARAREAVRERYRLLPYLYTLFAAAHADGAPPMRPLHFEFPTDEPTFAQEDAFMLGPALLVRPVAQPGVSAVELRLPGAAARAHGGGEPAARWYDAHTSAYAGDGGARASLAAPPERIPVLQRGGTIVPRRERARRASNSMAFDPYTLVVAPDAAGGARGELYLDDGESYAHEEGAFAWRQLSYAGGTLECAQSASRPRGAAGACDAVRGARSAVERVVLLDVAAPPARVRLVGAGGAERELSFRHEPDARVLVVRKPDVPVCDDWSIVLEPAAATR